MLRGGDIENHLVVLLHAFRRGVLMSNGPSWVVVVTYTSHVCVRPGESSGGCKQCDDSSSGILVHEEMDILCLLPVIIDRLQRVKYDMSDLLSRFTLVVIDVGVELRASLASI